MNPWRRSLLLVVAPALHLPAAGAYTPRECRYSHAEADFRKCDLVAVARVTRLERVIAPIDGGEVMVSCLATLSIGRPLKGSLRKGEDLGMYIGGYPVKEIDDTVPTGLATHNTHAPLPLQINGVYLLCLVKERFTEDQVKKELDQPGLIMSDDAKRLIRRTGGWRPRSCHASIYEIVSQKGALGPVRIARQGDATPIFAADKEPARLEMPLAELLRQKEADLQACPDEVEVPAEGRSQAPAASEAPPER